MDIHYLGLNEVSERIRRRELTAEAVTAALLARIARHEGNLNSILLLLADQALAQARQADAEIDAGFWRGPLHGVPIGVKDIVWTANLPTTAGMEPIGSRTLGFRHRRERRRCRACQGQVSKRPPAFRQPA
jgi:amidase